MPLPRPEATPPVTNTYLVCSFTTGPDCSRRRRMRFDAEARFVPAPRGGRVTSADLGPHTLGLVQQLLRMRQGVLGRLHARRACARAPRPGRSPRGPAPRPRPSRLRTPTCRSAKHAICGRWVTTSTWRVAASLASRRPTASPASPPIPASISSNTSVGTSSRSARTLRHASITRESSPAARDLRHGGVRLCRARPGTAAPPGPRPPAPARRSPRPRRRSRRPASRDPPDVRSSAAATGGAVATRTRCSSSASSLDGCRGLVDLGGERRQALVGGLERREVAPRLLEERDDLVVRRPVLALQALQRGDPFADLRTVVRGRARPARGNRGARRRGRRSRRPVRPRAPTARPHPGPGRRSRPRPAPPSPAGRPRPRHRRAPRSLPQPGRVSARHGRAEPPRPRARASRPGADRRPRSRAPGTPGGRSRRSRSRAASTSAASARRRSTQPLVRLAVRGRPSAPAAAPRHGPGTWSGWRRRAAGGTRAARGSRRDGRPSRRAPRRS